MRFPFSSSIYTTQDPRLAARYAQEFKYNGETWQIMFQNRANPNTLERVASSPAGADDVRPDGFFSERRRFWWARASGCDTNRDRRRTAQRIQRL
jgi:hypothetical protein